MSLALLLAFRSLAPFVCADDALLQISIDYASNRWVSHCRFVKRIVLSCCILHCWVLHGPCIDRWVLQCRSWKVVWNGTDAFCCAVCERLSQCPFLLVLRIPNPLVFSGRLLCSFLESLPLLQAAKCADGLVQELFEGLQSQHLLQGEAECEQVPLKDKQPGCTFGQTLWHQLPYVTEVHLWHVVRPFLVDNQPVHDGRRLDWEIQAKNHSARHVNWQRYFRWGHCFTGI